MFGLLGRTAGTLLAILGIALVMLWQWAYANPLLAAILIPGGLCVVFTLAREHNAKRAALLDAIGRDSHVPSMSPAEYEQYTARQLEQAGWNVTHCGRQGDQGCDVIAELRGFKAVIQCKLYRKRCGNSAVQEIVGARRHYGAQIMAVVCPAGFTESAQQLAASNGVHLLHHSQLHSLEAKARIP